MKRESRARAKTCAVEGDGIYEASSWRMRSFCWCNGAAGARRMQRRYDDTEQHRQHVVQFDKFVRYVRDDIVIVEFVRRYLVFEFVRRRQLVVIG